MKYIQIVLILFSLMVFSSAGYCQDAGRVYWGGTSPKDVAAKANGMQYGSASGADYSIPMGGMNFDPAMGMMNSMLMMQNGGVSANNPCQMQEQQKQQLDYAKQQMKDAEDAAAQEKKENAIKPVQAVKHINAKVVNPKDEGEENFNTEW